MEIFNHRERFILWAAALTYLVMVSLTVLHHEPWSDEAQSWLLARDSNLLHLWTGLLRYEGTPGLWPSLLNLLIGCGMPYGGMNIVSALAGFSAAWLVLSKAPVALVARILLPFSYFLCYQSAVIARNYCLLPPLLFGCAVLFKRASERVNLMTILLCLLAAVSAQGWILSLSIWLVLQFQRKQSWATASAPVRRRALLWGAAYLATLIAIAASAWPAQAISFGHPLDFSVADISDNIVQQLQFAFGGGVLPILAIGISLPFLRRGGGLPIFVLSSVALLFFGAVVYSSAWQSGAIFLIWLFSIWISTEKARPGPLVTGTLILVAGIQCYWTGKAISYDWKNPYSGGSQAAEYIRSNKILDHPLFGIGFASVSVQPYFRQNIFANFDPGAGAFWRWSKSNHVNDTVEQLGSRRPDYVLISYMSPPEKKLWSGLVSGSGYRWVKHFEGNIFWQTHVLQPDALDLYERGPATCDRSLVSTVDLADNAHLDQLLWGFYDEGKTWRWTARKFTVILKRPPNARLTGAKLKLHFYLPQEQIDKLGHLSLVAYVSGYRLRHLRLTTGGAFDYVRDVPASAFYEDMVPVDFSFDKATPPSARDARELGAVVMSIALVSP